MVSFKELRSEDVRQNVRVKDRRRIVWQLQESDIKGQGRIHNISTSGMLLETNGLFIPHDRCSFNFTTNLGINNYVPKQGRVVWAKRKQGKANRYLCGVSFVEPAGFVLSKLHRKIESGLRKVVAYKVTEQTSNVLIFSGIIVLAGLVVWLSHTIYQDMVVTNQQLIGASNQQAAVTRNYISLYQGSQVQLKDSEAKLQWATSQLASTRQMYQQSQVMLTEVNSELEATKAILAETETMLAQAKQGAFDTAQLNEAQLERTRQELMNTIALLEEKNIQLAGEMNVVNSKLTYYEGNVKDLAAGESLIKMYRKKLKEVRNKVRHFNREASSARIAALREQDRIRLILGNNGFFMKDGQQVKVDQEKYNTAVFQPTKTEPAPAKNVKIDVTIVD